MTSRAKTTEHRVCPRCGEAYPPWEEHPCPLGESLGPPDPLIGGTVGTRYHIESFVQSGGMGVVYRARHLLLNKIVAIKVLREAENETNQERFLREAQASSGIAHQHVVQVFDFGILDDGRPYLVMEFLQGRSLEELLYREAPLGAPRAGRIARQIAQALSAAHDQGIVHRDLKPGNIFLVRTPDAAEFVKVLDFGIAKITGAGQRRLTQQGMAIGTPEYMSPEQATGRDSDHRADQYALGCMLYEMLTGELPFSAESPMGVLAQHVTVPAEAPRQRRPDLDIPEVAEAIVMRTLAKDPAARFPHMRDLAEHLQEVEALGAPPPSAPRVPLLASVPRGGLPALSTAGEELAEERTMPAASAARAQQSAEDLPGERTMPAASRPLPPAERSPEAAERSLDSAPELARATAPLLPPRERVALLSDSTQPRVAAAMGGTLPSHSLALEGTPTAGVLAPLGNTAMSVLPPVTSTARRVLPPGWRWRILLAFVVFAGVAGVVLWVGLRAASPRGDTSRRPVPVVRPDGAGAQQPTRGGTPQEEPSLSGAEAHARTPPSEALPGPPPPLPHAAETPLGPAARGPGRRRAGQPLLVENRGDVDILVSCGKSAAVRIPRWGSALVGPAERGESCICRAPGRKSRALPPGRGRVRVAL